MKAVKSIYDQLGKKLTSGQWSFGERFQPGMVKIERSFCVAFEVARRAQWPSEHNSSDLSVLRSNGITNTLNYGNFDFTVVGSGSHGNQLRE